MTDTRPTRTIAHPGGPVHFALDVSAAEVEILVEDCKHAEVTLTPIGGSSDEHTADLIARTASTSSGSRFAVDVPRAAGVGSTVISRNGGATCVVTGSGGTIIQSSGNVTIINGQVVSGHGVTVIQGGSGIRVTARLPIGSSLSIDTAAADVVTHGHLESIRFRATSGSLNADSTLDLDAEVSSGDIRVNRADAVEASASSGDVTIGATRQVRVTASSGSIRVSELSGTARCRASSGSIRVNAVAKSAVRASASSGDVTVTANPGVEVEADARSSSGRVRTPKPVA